jgi:hypothetical protein
MASVDGLSCGWKNSRVRPDIPQRRHQSANPPTLPRRLNPLHVDDGGQQPADQDNGSSSM